MSEHINILKERYPFTVRITGLIGILILIAMFMIFPRFITEEAFVQQQEIVIEQIDIPQTQQADKFLLD